MKFAVGYQPSEEGEEPFINVVRDFKRSIEEVYFPWPDMPSGRMPLGNIRGVIDWESQKKLEEDLSSLKNSGIKLDLLFNANCYGKYSLSKYLVNLVCSTVDYLHKKVGLDVITTTSLTIAKAVKDNFNDVEVRASVNMRLGTVKSLGYLKDLFDSFYLQREYNRDFEKIREIKGWCDSHNKRLYMLANSGCLNFCSAQIFHDNLIAHETEINETVNVRRESPSLCWDYYKDRDNWVAFLQNSWVRPEDIKHYENYFTMVKLATRMHSNPRKVIQAYAEGKFNGNLLDLLEPGHSPLFYPCVIDNTKFPDDWFEKITKCDKRCDKCDYCLQVLKKVLVRIDEFTGVAPNS